MIHMISIRTVYLIIIQPHAARFAAHIDCGSGFVPHNSGSAGTINSGDRERNKSGDLIAILNLSALYIVGADDRKPKPANDRRKQTAASADYERR